MCHVSLPLLEAEKQILVMTAQISYSNYFRVLRRYTKWVFVFFLTNSYALGPTADVYFANRPDGLAGTGYPADPYDYGTFAHQDAALANTSINGSTGLSIWHFAPGVYVVRGWRYRTVATVVSGVKIYGAGRDLTTFQLAGGINAPHLQSSLMAQILLSITSDLWAGELSNLAESPFCAA